MTRPPAGRLLALLIGMALALGGIVVRLAVLQVRESGTYEALGVEQRVRTEQLSAQRAEILDRNGSPLAITLDARDVYANPTLVTDPVGEAGTLAPILGVPRADVMAALRTAGTTFAYVDRGVPVDVATHVSDLALPGIGVLPSEQRMYPSGSIAAQVVGVTNVDGTGITGLEPQYDGARGDTGGADRGAVGEGQQIAGGVQIDQEPQPGPDLELTIDRQMQFQTQVYLRQAVEANHAKGGTVIVMDPRTGEIYAMATYPSFDPNAFSTADPSHLVNRAVTDTLEPGSVNKTITAAAALSSGAVRPTDTFQVAGTRWIEGYTIHDAESHGTETMTLGDIIAHSSNVGISLVADQVGNQRLEQTFHAFGYGAPTGVGFPGEAAGSCRRATSGARSRGRPSRSARASRCRRCRWRRCTRRSRTAGRTCSRASCAQPSAPTALPRRCQPRHTTASCPPRPASS